MAWLRLLVLDHASYNILSLTIRVILPVVGNRWTIVNFSWNPVAVGVVVANIADSIAVSVFLVRGGIINSLRWRFGVKLVISIFDENPIGCPRLLKRVE